MTSTTPRLGLTLEGQYPKVFVTVQVAIPAEKCSTRVTHRGRVVADVVDAEEVCPFADGEEVFVISKEAMLEAYSDLAACKIYKHLAKPMIEVPCRTCELSEAMPSAWEPDGSDAAQAIADALMNAPGE